MKIRDRADLDLLLTNQLPEGLELDYKESPAADIAAIDGLASDVCSFANSSGGQILIGIKEQRDGGSKTGTPEGPDAGVDVKTMTVERLDQLLSSRIRPAIPGLLITPISLPTGNAVIVIDIPAPGPLAPHQAPDHKYYRRQNRRREPMYDHEIKLLMNRMTLPDLSLSLGFYPGDATSAPLQQFSNSNGQMPGFQIDAFLHNNSWQPPSHWLVEIGFDRDLELLAKFEFADRGLRDGLRSLTFNSHSAILPPFRTAPANLGIVARLGIRIIQGDANSYSLRWVTACPGQALECKGLIQRRGQTMSIVMDEPRSIA
jgi:hypothetical protein